MSEVSGGKLRLHLMAEKALGLSGLPVGKRKAGAGGAGGGKSGKAAVRPVGPGGERGTAAQPVSRPAGRAEVAKGPAIAPPAVAPPRVVVPLVAEAMFPSKDEPLTSAVLSTAQKRVRLTQLDENKVRGCQKCVLGATRTNTVFGTGDVDARLMFIGEGPGENEDLQGLPFVGRAGELLTKQIGAMGLTREQVFICNIVKCRPPENRQPMPEEVSACTPYLLEQIEVIRPSVIVTLGLPATKFMLADDKIAMGKARGQWHVWRGIPVRPTYHPAYLLRSYTDNNRRLVWEDLQAVMEKLGLSKPKRAGD